MHLELKQAQRGPDLGVGISGGTSELSDEGSLLLELRAIASVLPDLLLQQIHVLQL